MPSSTGLEKCEIKRQIITPLNSYPVGEGRECTDVGDVGVCLGPPRKGPTVPPLSTVFSIKHPPDEVAAIAAVLINLYSNQTAYYVLLKEL